MACYAIGDIQGCYDEFMRLLQTIQFDPKRDQLWLCGDIINRGPKSLEVIDYVMQLGTRAVTVLGNHDLHFLALANGIGKPRRQDTLGPLLESHRLDDLIQWIRHQPLLHYDEQYKALLVHAGIYPQWNLAQAKSYANEVEAQLQSDNYVDFLNVMYGNQPNCWQDDLSGFDRIRFITNVFTRMRFCDAEGHLDMHHKGAIGTQAAGLQPWYEFLIAEYKQKQIFFGHWSTLGESKHANIHALDSGCLWGGKLTAMRVDAPSIIQQINCEADLSINR
ncbi:MAG: symmetrical bis(5'-nucleosyl)-tetraphosphatase [Gammaproteobacteria bacterium]|nr:symmetrical bis(5'-nucleosyl)-tetraphosphatase [Gammaproteobacteria bacterium]MDH5731646.1 symmetrical bis(5'-nucleosyl)-tetraphosphatase [Gammaproteobacteria bacterium]